MLCFSYRFRRSPRVLPVYWKGMLDMPVIGAFLQSFGGFPISHAALDASRRTAEMMEMLEALAKGFSIQLAPEGRRNDRLGRFNHGAALLSLMSGCPVVPCSLRGVQPLFKELPYPSRLWGRVEMHCHSPIAPGPYGLLASRAEAMQSLTKAIRDAIASGIDYPVDPEPGR